MWGFPGVSSLLGGGVWERGRFLGGEKDFFWGRGIRLGTILLMGAFSFNFFCSRDDIFGGVFEEGKNYFKVTFSR